MCDNGWIQDAQGAQPPPHDVIWQLTPLSQLDVGCISPLDASMQPYTIIMPPFQSHNATARMPGILIDAAPAPSNSAQHPACLPVLSLHPDHSVTAAVNHWPPECIGIPCTSAKIPMHYQNVRYGGRIMQNLGHAQHNNVGISMNDHVQEGLYNCSVSTSTNVEVGLDDMQRVRLHEHTATDCHNLTMSKNAELLPNASGPAQAMCVSRRDLVQQQQPGIYGPYYHDHDMEKVHAGSAAGQQGHVSENAHASGSTMMMMTRKDCRRSSVIRGTERKVQHHSGKDRHSKVKTAKGMRDRRVRLSVSTAAQFYDIQDRLGFQQPSRVFDWLMQKAKHAIDQLPESSSPQPIMKGNDLAAAEPAAFSDHRHTSPASLNKFV